MKTYRRLNPFTNATEDLTREGCLALYDRVKVCGDEAVSKAYWAFIHRDFREEMEREVTDALNGVFSEENRTRMGLPPLVTKRKSWRERWRERLRSLTSASFFRR